MEKDAKKKLTPRQAEIVDAALKLISERGIGHLTIRNLSADIGVTEAALYRHFPGKMEIIQAMVSRFEGDVDAIGNLKGWAAVEAALVRRTELVLAKPDLARVLFAEELFKDSPEIAQILHGMMQRHRKVMETHFREAVEEGSIRPDIPMDTLFRLILGPTRLLIKQWGLSNAAFDLRAKRDEMLSFMRELLAPKH
ncbi:MAG: TetR/AcrR family transcriptional regulator [Victivallales bacterium]|jgi:AcrR family transcriptional regulator|nr:TetR/AcrR family transcriptional regulator [Victivallales bacterium]